MTKTYTFEEALKDSIEYFAGDSMAAEVFVGKYALRNKENELIEKTPTDMHRRIAKELARIEEKYPNPLSEKQIFDLLDHFKYIVPQGSPMAGIGNIYQITSLSNCYVIDSPKDSYSGILYSDTQLANLMKRRAGVGMDLSLLRPKDMLVKNAAGTTTGIGTFMERYSATTREVGQSGRRGALIETISIHHPEIETFISIKKDLKKVTGANISIQFSDEFMFAVENDTDYEMRWPVDSATPSISKRISAKYIWEKFIEAAWLSAEPGATFQDTIRKMTPADVYRDFGFKTISVNPCGEINLSAFDSCRLLLLNPVSYVNSPFTSEAWFDYKLFSEHAVIGQRLMDDIVDLELECIEKIINKVSSDPEPEEVKRIELDLWNKIKTNCTNGRRTGLGLTAIGDTLASLNIRYGSNESIQTVEEIYKTLALSSYRSSVIMAKERGAFPVYDINLEKDHPFIVRIMNEDLELKGLWEKYGRRNIANLTTAPAGSVSILTQTTSGIEPAFLLSYTRRKKINPNDKNSRVDFIDDSGDKWQEYKIYHHGFKKWMEINGKSEADVSDSPYAGATANEIDWMASVTLQSVAQKWIDHSISKTCNLPESASKELVSDIYMKAWKLGCKGFTIYREGSRSGVLIADAKPKQSNSFSEHHAPKRAKELPCDIITATVNGEKWTFVIGLFDNKPYEIFGGLSKFVQIPKRVKKGKISKHNGSENPIARYDLHYDYETGSDDETIIKDITNVFENKTNAAFTRTISLSLRHGVPAQYVVEQLLKGSEKEDELFSFSRAVARVLKIYIKDGTKASGKKCPECGSDKLVYKEGCMSCLDCTYSKCG